MVERGDLLLVTGANGFIGSRVVRALLAGGFRRVRCLTRRTTGSATLEALRTEFPGADLEIVTGNLLSRETCSSISRGVSVVYHLAAGIDTSFPGCFLNSVVTTRNLLDAVTGAGTLKRFVNISSFAVYSNDAVRRGGLIDESCAVDTHLVERHDPYAYGKAMQDALVEEYGRTRDLPYVIVRPGVTFGPGKTKIPGRVGIDTFGVFLHIGLRNRLPLTYVENCADAIVLAGLRPGVEGQVINIVDDELPRSGEFLRRYKQRVRRFASIPMPYPLFFLLNLAWEKYSEWSEGQLPPAFNRRACAAYFRRQTYSNARAKKLLGWRPRVSMNEGLDRYCDYAREAMSRT